MDCNEFGNAQQQCADCDWKGLGRETSIHESFHDGADFHCPECGYSFGLFSWPMNLNKPVAESE